MASEAKPAESIFTPRVHSAVSRRVLEQFVRRMASALGRAPHEERNQAIHGLLEKSVTEKQDWPAEDRTNLEAGLRILSDLALQGWRLSITSRGIRLLRPVTGSGDAHADKKRIREQELLKRDEQLATPAVRTFIKKMERRRVSLHGFSSIFSLFRDGRDLADQLRQARTQPFEDLAAIVDPYLVFFNENDCCPITGLRLMDVWRYFRHTWANQYESVPGRSMVFLVRDRAVASHPVIGIGQISSPIVQIRERDTWIGWHPETLLHEIEAKPSAKIGRWLQRTVDKAIDEIYIQDFLEESDEEGRLLSPSQLQSPTIATITQLREYGGIRRKRHQKFPDGGEHKTVFGSDGHGPWATRARTNLFTAKRATALAEFLEARLVLERFLGERPTKRQVADLAADRDGRRVILRAARKAKADRVGIAMADISVCGAVPPYGALLGGKLVSMLAASPEVVSAYRQRYRERESEIASAMAGRAVRRPPDLVFFGTTSLYGRSSQYNRVRVPGERIGGGKETDLRYIELGESESFGTSQYSAQTLRALDDAIRESEQGKRVNNIFGEGTSPKLRKIRDGLTMLGFEENLLRHYRRRVVYGIPLIENLCDYLLGLQAKPKYLFKLDGETATKEIAAWWRQRWLSKRIQSDSVLESVAQHDLTLPIRHGARVQLPAEDTPQLNLFEDL